MSYGKRYAETLANDYLAINDKSYLKAMVEKIEANAIADRERRGEIIDKGTFWGVDWQKRADGQIVCEVDGNDMFFGTIPEFETFIKNEWRLRNVN